MTAIFQICIFDRLPAQRFCKLTPRYIVTARPKLLLPADHTWHAHSCKRTVSPPSSLADRKVLHCNNFHPKCQQMSIFVELLTSIASHNLNCQKAIQSAV